MLGIVLSESDLQVSQWRQPIISAAHAPDPFCLFAMVGRLLRQQRPYYVARFYAHVMVFTGNGHEEIIVGRASCSINTIDNFPALHARRVSSKDNER